MAIDFSSIGGTPAHTGKIDFSAIGGIPAVGQDESADETSALGAAGRGATGMIPLGTQAYAGIAGLAENKPYLQERQELEKEIQADIENHPAARLAGQAAGVIAPALLTGGSSVPESLLGAAGQGAAIGAGFGAGNAIDTLASGGSGAKAAGDVALGAGLGAAGGAAGQGLGKILGGAAKTLVPSQDELAAETTAGVLGGTARQIRALPGKNPVATLNTMRDVMSNATVDGKPLISVGQRMPERLQNMITWQKQAGQTIGDTIKNAGVEPMELQPILDKISQSGKFLSPDDAAHLSSVGDDIAKYAENGKMPFDRLQQAKSDIGDQAFHGAGNPVLQNVYHVLSDAQDTELEKASAVISKPAFDLAKTQYQTASRAMPLLKMAAAKELGNKASLTAPAVAMVTGHPLVAGAALAKNRGAQLVNSAMFKAAGALPEGVGAGAANIPAIAGSVEAAKTAPTAVNIDHPALAQWKPMFQKAAANATNPGEVQKSQAVTDFTLSQRDPAYAAAKQKASENPVENQTPTNMADGGVVEVANDFSKPTPGFGSTLPGLENQMKHPTHETPPAEPDLPVRSTDTLHQPFNSDFADKLRAFMADQKEKDNAESR